uniref:Uncharacterized protein n=1 Tax=Moniliophthora roreri TaxID=221103 RepID=A0A0W0F7V2_MONRR
MRSIRRTALRYAKANEIEETRLPVEQLPKHSSLSPLFVRWHNRFSRCHLHGQQLLDYAPDTPGLSLYALHLERTIYIVGLPSFGCTIAPSSDYHRSSKPTRSQHSEVDAMREVHIVCSAAPEWDVFFQSPSSRAASYELAKSLGAMQGLHPAITSKGDERQCGGFEHSEGKHDGNVLFMCLVKGSGDIPRRRMEVWSSFQ